MPNINTTARYASQSGAPFYFNSVGAVLSWRLSINGVWSYSSSNSGPFTVSTSNQRYANSRNGVLYLAEMFVDFECVFDDVTQYDLFIAGGVGGAPKVNDLRIEFTVECNVTYQNSFDGSYTTQNATTAVTFMTGQPWAQFQSSNNLSFTPWINAQWSFTPYTDQNDEDDLSVLNMKLNRWQWGTVAINPIAITNFGPTYGPLSTLVIDWGDGSDESTYSLADISIALGNPIMSRIYETLLVQHDFTKNAGPQCSYYVVDIWGRKSNVVTFAPQPTADFEILDNGRGGLIIDTSRSFCQGNPFDFAVTVYNAATNLGVVSILPDLSLDSNGNQFQIEPRWMQNTYVVVSTVLTPKYITMNHQFETKRYDIKRRDPIYARASYANSFHILCSSAGFNGLSDGDAKLFQEELSGSSTIMKSVNRGDNGKYPGQFPRISIDDGDTYLGVYSIQPGRIGQTWLYFSEDQGRSFSEVGQMWPEGYFNFDFTLLQSSGGCSVAMKRKDNIVGQGEFWFKRTGDLENWEAAPVKVTGTEVFDEVTYPRLVCEENARRSPVFWMFLGQLCWKSNDGGVTWIKIA